MSNPPRGDEDATHLDVSRRRILGATGVLLAGGVIASRDEKVARGMSPPTLPPTTLNPQAAERESLKQAKVAVEKVEKTILKISREVWNKPAVGLQEQEAMEVHIRELEGAGFKIISRQSGGHPTAFIAQWRRGSGGPKIGFLPEYDALPGLGNAAEPLVKPAENGRPDGHGCGHNCLGAGCTGAAIALKAMMLERNVVGTLRVYGCGAEENVGPKIFMAKQGLFDDLDSALAWHPATVPVTGTFLTNANHFMRVSWKGRTAHAGMDPWNGRSALDAAELFAHGVNLMREHIEPTARLHYIYEIAGVAPNVVPDEARIWIQARDITTLRVNAITEWLSQLAEGVALGTQTKATFKVELGMAEFIPNETLARRVFEHLQNVPLDWTPEEQAFATACQRAMGTKELGLATQVAPFIEDAKLGGSTDVADVSWITPVAVFGWPTIPLGVNLHTWAVTACGATSIGDKGSLASAAILAAVGYELMTEPELLKAAKEEWKQRLDGRKYQAVQNMDLTELQEISTRCQKAMNDEYLSGTESR
ncbi:amidohydrolase [Pirellulaceae bacterium SH449]